MKTINNQQTNIHTNANKHNIQLNTKNNTRHNCTTQTQTHTTNTNAQQTHFNIRNTSQNNNKRPNNNNTIKHMLKNLQASKHNNIQLNKQQKQNTNSKDTSIY